MQDEKIQCVLVLAGRDVELVLALDLPRATTRKVHRCRQNETTSQQMCLLGIIPQPGEAAWATLCKIDAHCKCTYHIFTGVISF